MGALFFIKLQEPFQRDGVGHLLRQRLRFDLLKQPFGEFVFLPGLSCSTVLWIWAMELIADTYVGWPQKATLRLIADGRAETTRPRDHGTTRQQDSETTGPQDHETTGQGDDETTGPRDYGTTGQRTELNIERRTLNFEPRTSNGERESKGQRGKSRGNGIARYPVADGC
jgi:hypothetical protein